MVMNAIPTEVEPLYHFIPKEGKTVFYWVFYMLPVVFSHEWGVIDFQPFPYTNKYPIPLCIMKYFDLSINEFNHLFMVNSQIPEIYGGVMLKHDAEPWELGANILWFLKNKIEKC